MNRIAGHSPWPRTANRICETLPLVPSFWRGSGRFEVMELGTRDQAWQTIEHEVAGVCSLIGPGLERRGELRGIGVVRIDGPANFTRNQADKQGDQEHRRQSEAGCRPPGRDATQARLPAPSPRG